MSSRQIGQMQAPSASPFRRRSLSAAHQMRRSTQKDTDAIPVSATVLVLSRACHALASEDPAAPSWRKLLWSSVTAGASGRASPSFGDRTWRCTAVLPASSVPPALTPKSRVAISVGCRGLTPAMSTTSLRSGFAKWLLLPLFTEVDTASSASERIARWSSPHRSC